MTIEEKLYDIVSKSKLLKTYTKEVLVFFMAEIDYCAYRDFISGDPPLKYNGIDIVVTKNKTKIRHKLYTK